MADESGFNPRGGFVSLQLSGDANLVSTQDYLKSLLKDERIQWTDTEKFHVTLVYCADVDEIAFHESAKALNEVKPTTETIISSYGFGVFENGSKRALHLVVEDVPEIRAVQQFVYDQLATRVEQVSEYSQPENWKPHITLAYLPADVDLPTLPRPVLTVARGVLFQRDDYTNVAYVPLNRGFMDEAWISQMKTTHDGQSTPEDSALVYYGGAVKAVGNGVIEGHLVMYGDSATKDLQGEYFSTRTDFFLDRGYPVKGDRTLYHHGMNKRLGPRAIGEFTDVELDDVGMFVRAELDMADAYTRAIYALAEKGKLGFSSGALPQSYRAAPDGEILQWAIIEGSLTPTPADPRNRARVMPVKSLLDIEELAIEPLEAVGEPDAVKSVDDALNPPDSQALPNEGTSNMNETLLLDGYVRPVVDALLDSTKTTLTAEERASVEAAALKAVADKMDEMSDEDKEDEKEDEVAMKAVQNEAVLAEIAKQAREIAALRQNALTSAAKAFVNAADSTPQSKVNATVSQPAPRIEVRSKYADLSHADMAFLHALRQAHAAKTDWHYVAEKPFVAELADKAQKAYSAGALKFSNEAEDVRTRDALLRIKANELDYSTYAGYGDEWVPNVWSSDLWEKSRLENPVASNLGMVDMPSNPFELPIQGADPTVYYVAETTAENQMTLADSNSPIPDSKIGTGKVTLTAGKLALRHQFSAEVVEDSIIAYIPNARAQALRAMQDAVDYAFLNGDTETGSTNINYDGSSAVAGSKYLIFNGLIKLPLVTATSYQVNASGAAPTLALLRSVRAKLPAAYGINPRNLMWVTDYSTYMRLLAIDEVSSAANRGAAPTGVTGVLSAIDGVDLFVSEQMALADTDGKVTAAGNTTNTGRAVLVHKPSWTAGYRRRVVTALEYFPFFESYQMAAAMRVAFINRDNTCAGLLFNIGI